MMQMTFHFAKSVTDFLFKGWTTHSAGGFAGVCFVVALAAILIEIIKFVNVYLHRVANSNPLTAPRSEEEIRSRPLLVRSLLIPPSIEHIRRTKILIHIKQTVLHMVQLLVGYLLMLAVMYYNAWIAITVALASGLGYFLFGALRTETIPLPMDANVNPTEFSATRLIAEGGEREEQMAMALTTDQPPPASEEQLVTADVHVLS